jgi:hypothetical protein
MVVDGGFSTTTFRGMAQVYLLWWVLSKELASISGNKETMEKSKK